MATFKLPRKPKLKKFPKTPKSKSLEVLKRYADKCAAIQKENDKKMADYKSEVKGVEAAKKKVLDLKEKARKIKSKSY